MYSVYIHAHSTSLQLLIHCPTQTNDREIHSLAETKKSSNFHQTQEPASINHAISAEIVDIN